MKIKKKEEGKAEEEYRKWNRETTKELYCDKKQIKMVIDEADGIKEERLNDKIKIQNINHVSKQIV